MKSRKLMQLGRRKALSPTLDWLKEANSSSAKVFIWVERRRFYGWAFTSSHSVIRPRSAWWDRVAGNVQADLISRLALIGSSCQIDKLSIFAPHGCDWDIASLPSRFNVSLCESPSSVTNMCLARREALHTGQLDESQCELLRKYGYAAKLEALELAVLRSQSPEDYAPQIRYLMGLSKILPHLS